MKAIFYYIFAGFSWVISLLPLSVLYFFSYLLYIVLFYLPGYRKRVTLNNLRNSFPEKSEEEINVLCKKFYHHLADMFVEGIKLQNMSHDELNRRFRILNPELINSYAEKGRDAVAAFGHYCNWEWIIGLQSSLDHRVLTVYKPLHNRYFDRHFLKVRSRLGMNIVPMASILRTIITYKKEGINTLTALVADQTPPKREIQFWTKFLNQDTPVYLGVEKLAQKFNMVVFFYKIRKVKRGFYELEAEVITDDPNSLDEFELTKMHIKKLEDHICEQPEFWLWSHRRWKHKKPEQV